VLLHGLASNSTRWSELVAHTSLGESWDLLRPDLRGNGASVWRGRLGMREWCADLAEILDAEGYARAMLVGHCLGANVAIEFASRHSERVTGLVLIEPMPREALTGTLGTIARFAPLVVPAAALVRAINALGFHRRRLGPLDLAELDREPRAAMARGAGAAALEQRYRSWRLDLRATATAAYLQMLLAVTRGLPDPGTLRAPALALLSTGAAFTDPAITERWLARVPSCRVVRLDARHWIPTERPAEMRRAIEEFCRA
jgi:pimeloyl-ACP methyl ester carboxylesterase